MKHYSLLLLSLAIVACAPPYSAELNSAAPLAGQMTLLGTLGPIKSPGGESTTDVKFLPIKPTSSSTIDTLDWETGFLVSQGPDTESLCFAYKADGYMHTTDFQQGFSLKGADKHYPLFQYELVTPTTTTSTDILVLKIDPATPAAGTADLFRATLPNGPFTKPSPPPTQQLTSVFGGPPVLGFSVFALPGADRFGFLFDNGSPLDGDGTANLNGSTVVFDTSASGSTNIQFPGTQKRALYYNNGQTGTPYRGYASYYDAGNWLCYRWDLTVNPATLMSGVTHRIDALLTNGDLISTEDSTLRIYDPNGSEKLSVGLGALQFCYEAYVGSTPYVFFSLTLDFPRDNWAFRVYAIKTSKLRELKKS